MKIHKQVAVFVSIIGLILFSLGCQNQSPEQGNDSQEKNQEISQQELTASVPELTELHEVVYPLWHNAFPEKDYSLIKELLPKVESLYAELEEAKLPGILRDKQGAWNKGKQTLASAVQSLKQAAEADDKEAMLSQVESFHAAYERLVRIIRPLVPELEAFHKELYKLYHYYTPEYDLEKIKTAVQAMQDQIIPLKQVQLPERLAEKQEEFENSVSELEQRLNELNEKLKKESKEKILEAVDKVHTAYQNTERIFD
ncbi:MAG: hypothetical protein GF421_01965 [Candidatus Aminicenantes bacterium]|nr:hypothetical protein [Candidatus Aminicenantes bacterium]